MAVTLKNIAQECDVSVQTVSRILNPAFAHLYKEETQDLIRKKARELGYRPNAAAKAMKAGNFKSILLLQSKVPFFSNMDSNTYHSILTSLAEQGYRLVCANLPDAEQEAKKELGKLLGESFVDGILVNISRGCPTWLENVLESTDLPVIWIGTKHSRNCICHNDRDAAYEVTRRMIEYGHAKIFYTDYIYDPQAKDFWHFSTIDREDGYTQAMLEAGLEPQTIRMHPHTWDNADVAYTETHVLSPALPTAILTYGTRSLRAVVYALTRRNMQVPRDMSLATFSSSLSHENDIDMATFLPCSRNIGSRSVDLLLERMENNGTDLAPVVTPFEFHEGKSISKPPKRGKK